MAQIQVKLDVTADPPVTCLPHQQGINHGNETITWTPFANQQFTFVSLTFAPPNPFTVTVNPTSVTAIDDNTTPGVYEYVVVVTQGGVKYSSASGKIMTGGPTIKNN